MGSRVSVIEKRLDETKEALAGVERLRAKNTAHVYEMKCLSAKVSELSPLVGVEERIKRLVETTQVGCLLTAIGTGTVARIFAGSSVLRSFARPLPTKLPRGFQPSSENRENHLSMLMRRWCAAQA